MSTLVKIALLDLGINLVSFAISAPLQTERLYDFTGTGTFLVTVVYSLLPELGSLSLNAFSLIHPRKILVSTLTLTWATRLLLHIVSKVNYFGDRRFDKIKKVVWVFVTAFPIFKLNISPPEPHPELFSLWSDYAGLSLWAIGFFFETVADFQKFSWQVSLGEKRFKTVMDKGLFKYSRYPQYFGEITLWCGMYLICSGAYPLNSVTRYAMAISPIFVPWLLIRVSGIRLQENQGNERYKDIPRWQEYKSTTNLLFPWFPSAPKKKLF
ncbi:hypothetical protein HK096_004014 [Nowakowskiella sp. JEL0078]|nr:hypothetical protein HK096_004014 [Nowakowskiella sp. JEL0078]